MYELTVRKQFAAAHSLYNYNGHCAQLHGHTWTVEVSVAGYELDEKGMLIDFHEIKRLVVKVIENLDHQYLNNLEPFNQPGRNTNPTAENIARYIYQSLKPVLKPGIRLTRVVIGESPDTWACYSEES